MIREVAAANDIVDIIGSYTDLKKSGAKWKALSPFTNERTASFYVDPAKQLWYCWSSGEGGDIFKFLQKIENISFPEALKKLAERANIRLNEMEMTPEMKREDRLRRDLKEANRLASEFFHALLMNSPAARPARDYLKGRGLTGDLAKRWLLGYAPEQNSEFHNWARQNKLREEVLLRGGLLAKSQHGRGTYPFFRHRLMFPINDQYGNCIAFSGRVLSAEQKGGKYVNSPETPLFQKSANFFGFDKSKRPILAEGTAILCEGQLDMMAAFEAGVENIVAPLGTAFTSRQAQMLRQNAKEVVICYDADRAGIKAADRAFTELAKEGVLVRIAKMPEGDDPDSMIQRDGADAFKKVISDAVDYFDFQVESLGLNPVEMSIRDRAQLLEKLAEKVASIQDTFKRDLIIDRLSTRLRVSPDEIRKSADKLALQQAMQAKRQAFREKKESVAKGPPVMWPESNAIRYLCRLIISSADARDWILEFGERELLADVVGTELLGVLWDGDFDPSDASSMPAYLANLTDDLQSTVTRLLASDIPTGGASEAEDGFNWLARESTKNRLASKKSRMRDPSIPTEEMMGLMLEVQNLQIRLQEIPIPKMNLE